MLNRLNSMSQPKRDISWDEVGWMCNKIGIYVRENRLNIALVAGIRRGGIIPASIVAYNLGVESLVISDLYGFQSFDLEKILVIDDVSDTGETFQRFTTRPRAAAFKTAVLVSKPWISMGLEPPLFTPDYTAEWMTEWVVFPWER